MVSEPVPIQRCFRSSVQLVCNLPAGTRADRAILVIVAALLGLDVHADRMVIALSAPRLRRRSVNGVYAGGGSGQQTRVALGARAASI